MLTDTAAPSHPLGYALARGIFHVPVQVRDVVSRLCTSMLCTHVSSAWTVYLNASGKDMAGWLDECIKRPFGAYGMFQEP